MHSVALRLLLLGAALWASPACSEDAATELADAGRPDASPAPRCPASPTPHIVFVNRDGGTYVGAYENNASENKAGLLGEGQTFALAPPEITDGDWEEITNCVNLLLEDYNIAVVDDDPGAVEHQEIVFLRSLSEIGLPDAVNGVAPFTCGSIPRGTSFVATKPGTQSNREVCEIAVAGLGTMAGIEHVAECTDVFSNQAESCGDKTITDAELECGDYGIPQTCQCSGQPTLNPHEKMTTAYGACES